MPFETLDEKQLADYLMMDARDVAKLASRGKLPCRKRGGEFVFCKIEIDHWVETQLHELPHDRLTEIERGVRRHHGLEYEDHIITEMIPAGGVILPLASRTSGSVLRDLLERGDQLELVYDRDQLLKEIEDRESLHSTALIRDVALPHPRHHTPYDVADSFIVVGRSERGIPFGCPDGSLTKMFFLVCCKDDRTHLHVLARLSRMLSDRPTLDLLLEAPDESAFFEVLALAEARALK